jgi:hypothetical protein
MYLKLTEEQHQLLQRLWSIEIGKKADVKFENPTPEEDARAIRRICYLDGGIDLIKYLLEFDSKLEEAMEEEKRARLSQQPGQQPPASSDNQPETF